MKSRGFSRRDFLRAVAAGAAGPALHGCAGLSRAERGDAPFSFIYVSPDGDDGNPGTKARPMATLAGARNAVRRLKKQKPGRSITVWFSGGTYRLRETAVFSLADSAPRGCTVTYSALPGESPLFSSGVAITGWRKLAEPVDGLPEAARGKVHVAELPAEVDRFYTLFDGEKRLPRARMTGFTSTEEAQGWSGGEQNTIRFPEGAMKDWARPGDVEVSIVTAAPWTMNVLPIESVDANEKIARTAIRGTYFLAKPRFGKFQQGSVFVENVFEGLDSPGRWVLDTKARKVYLWPLGARPSRRIFAPALTEFVRVEGRIDYDGPKDTPVRGLVFRGLTFLHGERYTWQPDQRGWGLQHDWEMFDRPTAMVRLRGAEDCAVENCRFAASGGTAVRLDLHCQRNKVANNLIEHVGGAGVLLAGYGPGTKDVNKQNEVANNRIHHVGETYWHSAVVFAWQSGENRIAQNLIHNTPYTGIVVSGRIGMDRNGLAECSKTVRWAEIDKVLGPEPGPLSWQKRERFLHARKNIVELNEIRDVMETLEDGNCVYVSGCGGGNTVRLNYLHHCLSPHMAEGIRCDDDQHDTTIDRNILWLIGGLATCVAIKGVNHVTNNIMACPGKPTFRGMLSLECAPVTGSIVQRNIFYAVNPKDIVVYQGLNYYKNYAWLKECKADFNVYWNTSDPEWGERHLAVEQANGIELHSLAADPLFEDPDGGDFRLRKESPALALGFEPIDARRAGLAGKVGPAAL